MNLVQLQEKLKKLQVRVEDAHEHDVMTPDERQEFTDKLTKLGKRIAREHGDVPFREDMVNVAPTAKISRQSVFAYESLLTWVNHRTVIRAA